MVSLPNMKGVLHIEDCIFQNNGGASSARQVDWENDYSSTLTIQLNVSETSFSGMPASKYDIYMGQSVRPRRELQRLPARPPAADPPPTRHPHPALPRSPTIEIAAATRSPTAGP